MHRSENKNFQVFVQSAYTNIGVPSQTLTVNANSTIRSLIHQFLFPNSSLTHVQKCSFYLTHNGKVIKDSSQIAPLSTLILQPRLLGGGGDGGATGAESRDCYLNMYAEKKPDKVDPNEQRLSKWTNCALSFEPLKPPVVLDKLGNVFNKEALVEALLNKKLPKEFSYMKGLKDMINIELNLIPGGEGGVDGTRFECPVSGLAFNGKYKFYCIKTCGHVLSAKALKEIKSSEGCLVCHKEFSESDKIVINGNEDEVAVLRGRMEEERLKVREKKGKKAKNGEVAVDAGTKLAGSKHGSDGVDVKGASNGASKRFKAIDAIPANATKEVYASIFTSSKKSNFKETYSCRSLPLGRN